MSAESVSTPEAEDTALNHSGVISALIAATAWASTGIFVRYLSDFSPAAIVAGRCFIALIGACFLLFLTKRNISFSDIFRSWTSWILGILMIGYYSLAVASYQLAPVAEVAILISTSPLFALGYRIARGLPTPPRKFIGALIAVSGVILIAGSSPTSSGIHSSVLQRLSGDGMALLGGAIMATYSTLYRNTNGQDTPSSQTVTFLTFLIGTLSITGWLTFRDALPDTQNFTDSNIVFFSCLGLGATVLPTFLYSFASQKLPSVIVTSIRLLTPLLAAVLAIIFLQEFPGILFWPGAVCILGGLFIISK